jgi:hypothetical protein
MPAPAAPSRLSAALEVAIGIVMSWPASKRADTIVRASGEARFVALGSSGDDGRHRAGSRHHAASEQKGPHRKQLPAVGRRSVMSRRGFRHDTRFQKTNG